MKKDTTYLCGKHPVMEALQAGVPIDRVWLQQGMRGEVERDLRHLCKALEIPIQFVPKPKLDFLTKPVPHQGIVAILAAVNYEKLANVLPMIYERGEVPFLLLLDGITDVRNFGAIARSAEVFGIHALVIPQKGIAQVNTEALKASAGALHNIPVCRESSIINAIEYLQSGGVSVFASDLQATTPMERLEWAHPCALVMGSEGEGIQPPIRRMADHTFKIPQFGKTGSLNVSVATGIILYEAARHRGGVQGA